MRGSEILKGLTCPDARWLRCSSSKTLGFPPRRALPSNANPAPSTFNLSEPRTSETSARGSRAITRHPLGRRIRTVRSVAAARLSSSSLRTRGSRRRRTIPKTNESDAVRNLGPSYFHDVFFFSRHEVVHRAAAALDDFFHFFARSVGFITADVAVLFERVDHVFGFVTGFAN